MQKTTPPDSILFTVESNDAAWSFYRPADPDLILNQITDEEYEKDRFLPFWAEHWPSSEVLFSYCTDTLQQRYTSICELGCGLGIISTALATAGHPVIATDISFQACSYTAANMRKYTENGRILCCDWRFPPFTNHFDLIVASDILYEKRWIEPVLLFLKNHLTENGSALIADPTRQNWEEFKSSAVSSGFAIEVIVQEKVNEGKTMVEILKIQKVRKRE